MADDFTVDDPWYWSVDRVVRELCTDQRTWPSKSPAQQMPERATLETNLRRQGVDGSTLLVDIDDLVLKKEFDIMVLGHRGTILHAIRELRLISRKWGPYYCKQEMAMAGNRKRSLSPEASSSPKINKRQKVDDEQENNTLYKYFPRLQVSNGLATTAAIIPVVLTTTANGKERKRIAPTLISSSVDETRRREIPTEADNVRHHDPHNIEPGVVYRTDDGRKRLVPLSMARMGQDELARRHQELVQISGHALHKGGEDGLRAAKDIISAEDFNQTRPDFLSGGYLGRKKMIADDIFYGSATTCSAVTGSQSVFNTDRTFNQVVFNNAISNGRRLYVLKLMNHYLNAPAEIVSRKGKKVSVLRPYPSSLAPIHRSPSLTVYQSNKDGKIAAIRDSLARWPEVDPSKRTVSPSLRGDGKNGPNFRGSLPDLLSGPSSYDSFDPDRLLKYMDMEGDKELPLYGESDEEGEYDTETWREIEKEQYEVGKSLSSSKRQPISVKDVLQAIDEGIAMIVVKWNQSRLPKCQWKTWKLWKKCRRNRAYKHERIREFQQHLDRLNKDRLVKLQTEILNQIWTSQKQVRKQVRIMEQSIFDREDLSLHISVLSSQSEPEHPPQSVVNIKSNKNDDESQDNRMAMESGSDADSSAESPDDGLGSFVTDDEESISAGDDLDLEGQNELDIQEGYKDDEISTPNLIEYEENTLSSGRARLISQRQTRKPSTEIDRSIVDSIDAGGDLNPELEFSSPPASPEIVDLTLLPSEQSASEASSLPSHNVVDLITPDRSLKSFRLKLKISQPSFGIIGEASIATTSSLDPLRNRIQAIKISDDDETIIPNPLPSLSDYASLGKYSVQVWKKLGDRKRFLISFICRNVQLQRKAALLEIFKVFDAEDMWRNMIEVMNSCIAGEKYVQGMDNPSFKLFYLIIRLFEMFIASEYRRQRNILPPSVVDYLKLHYGIFAEFHDVCLKVLADLNQSNDGNDDDEEESDPRPAARRKLGLVNTSEEDRIQPNKSSPFRIRKKKVFENAEAREIRQQDQDRLKEQDHRRKILRSLLEQSRDTNTDKVIINMSKFEHQGLVHVSRDIAKRIKPHQIDGVQFLWDQIVFSGGKQGCLLAHTMGLGKTMQAITLLVAIAEAVRSPHKSVSSQIPDSLVQSRSLILCPPGLIDNWMDELLMWAPEAILGDLRKIDSAVKTMRARLDLIDSWYQNGGVIVIGYEMFRKLVNNTKTEKREAALSPQDHATVLGQLQEGPNIVIADEAHKMKNAKSALTTSTNGFKTRSRIALTGSPLANNVEEYHTMMNWVAPNYLGPATEFRAKYVEPIQQGTYRDSTPYQRRKALKMLGVLQHNLAPKVNRADISVLRHDLKPKKEFVITVPLTKLQHDAYSIYVRSMIQNTRKDGVCNSTLWHWLAILGLLCNHPESFKSKLMDRGEEANSNLRDGGLASGEDTPGDSPQDFVPGQAVWKVGVSKELVQEELELLNPLGEAISNLEHSNKMMILVQILDYSREIGDKVLVFSQSLVTLDFLEKMFQRTNRKYARLDGSTKLYKRQEMTKAFNTGQTEVYLISTTAGGLGLNLPGANRVVILDFKWNPVHEEQAIGRAYRIGQPKPVFVYRLMTSGTFEQVIHNNVIYKTQLASRVVDKKNPVAWARKAMGDFLFIPKDVEQQDLSSFKGMDPMVLDKVLVRQDNDSTIRGIVMSDTFERHDDDALTVEEQREVKQMINDAKLQRDDPEKYQALLHRRQQDQMSASRAVNIPNQAVSSALRQPVKPPSYQPVPPIGILQSHAQLEPPAFSAPFFSSAPPTRVPPSADRTEAIPQPPSA